VEKEQKGGLQKYPQKTTDFHHT